MACQLPASSGIPCSAVRDACSLPTRPVAKSAYRLMRRGFHPLGKGFGLRTTIRAPNSSGLIMIVVMQLRMASGWFVTFPDASFYRQKAPRQEFTHRCKGVAFMFGKGQQRTQGDSCITAGFVVGTPLTSIRHLAARGRLYARRRGFCQMQWPGGVIEQQRKIIFTRENHTEGLVPKRLSRPWNGATIGIPTR